MIAKRGAYLPHIDGLRALAIGTVVAYHAFPEFAHGGFIGVDIFFVISGYLISSHIVEEIDKERFSFAAFYGRRVRRIFPALAVVLAASLLFGALSLDPSEYRALSAQAAGAAAFYSNILFWAQSGYFDDPSMYKPLLHTWSLAVEEQFYIFWPVAMALFLRLSRKARWRIPLGLAILSFAINVILARVDPVADFYLLPSRLWELAVGALLALSPSASSGLGRRGREALSCGGLGQIVVGLWVIIGRHGFPDFAALLPTLGAACLIAAGSGTLIARRLLSPPPVTYLGRISYPVYLWHWPLLAFARIIAGGEVDPYVRGSLIVVSIALSAATYSFVERPFRSGPAPRPRTIVAAACVVVLGAIAAMGVYRGGVVWPDRALVEAAYDGDTGAASGEFLKAHFTPCPARLFLPAKRRPPKYPLCRQSGADGVPDLVIIGDSHAQHLTVGLAEALPGHNVASYNEVAAYNEISQLFMSAPQSISFYQAIAAESGVRTVILSAYWAKHIHELRDPDDLGPEMRRTVEFLSRAGKAVYVLNDIPAFDTRPSRCKYTARLWLPQICEKSLGSLAPQLAETEPALRYAVEGVANAHFVDTWRFFCDAKNCSMTSGQKLLYQDTDHLNLNGSRWLGARLVEATNGFQPEM